MNSIKVFGAALDANDSPLKVLAKCSYINRLAQNLINPNEDFKDPYEGLLKISKVLNKEQFEKVGKFPITSWLTPKPNIDDFPSLDPARYQALTNSGEIKNFSNSYGIRIIEVNIHKLEEGVFFANILCDNGDQQITLDARTSDAIALALRFQCPIYTTEEIVEKAGIVLDFEKGSGLEPSDDPESPEEMAETEEKPVRRTIHPDLSDSSMKELKALLADAVAKEDYERASEIRDEINRRSK